ncbi:pentapeptide repeat-containing protein [Plantactinospora soyae]|uniref:Pentapeptide repeat-containing protein n=1 Tax=Plantactinospora soyae TaxID=1544732 RepID=A0A927M1H9_9ACTN|nr:pentapeptide repeat-containing protein [Plantactinospora soyae]MBE1486423.1 hypothetical protein [Plantactinospora soyae]
MTKGQRIYIGAGLFSLIACLVAIPWDATKLSEIWESTVRQWRYVAFTFAVIAASVAVVGGARQRRRVEYSGQGARWLSDRSIAAVTAIVAAVGLVVLGILLLVAEAAPPADRAKLRLDAIKYGIGVVASGGAVAALLLAVRRQRLSEEAHQLALRTQAHSETDAAERREIELYMKAVEHLGSTDAAVRLGAIYALERVAQNNENQRQTIVNVLCAYLRMPFSPPSIIDPLTDRVPPHQRKRENLSVGTEVPNASSSDQRRNAHEELLVRSTAQDALQKHLSRASESYWGELSLDLSGATLVNWRLIDCTMKSANFAGVVFHGYTDFRRVDFRLGASFSGADFLGFTTFSDSAFYEDVRFSYALFNNFAIFDNAHIYGYVAFQNTHFDDVVRLGNCHFPQGFTFEDNAFFYCTVRRRTDRVQEFPRGWTLTKKKGSDFHVLSESREKEYSEEVNNNFDSGDDTTTTSSTR